MSLDDSEGIKVDPALISENPITTGLSIIWDFVSSKMSTILQLVSSLLNIDLMPEAPQPQTPDASDSDHRAVETQPKSSTQAPEEILIEEEDREYLNEVLSSSSEKDELYRDKYDEKQESNYRLRRRIIFDDKDDSDGKMVKSKIKDANKEYYETKDSKQKKPRKSKKIKGRLSKDEDSQENETIDEPAQELDADVDHGEGLRKDNGKPEENRDSALSREETAEETNENFEEPEAGRKKRSIRRPDIEQQGPNRPTPYNDYKKQGRRLDPSKAWDPNFQFWGEKQTKKPRWPKWPKWTRPGGAVPYDSSGVTGRSGRRRCKTRPGGSVPNDGSSVTSRRRCKTRPGGAVPYDSSSLTGRKRCKTRPKSRSGRPEVEKKGPNRPTPFGDYGRPDVENQRHNRPTPHGRRRCKTRPRSRSGRPDVGKQGNWKYDKENPNDSWFDNTKQPIAGGNWKYDKVNPNDPWFDNTKKPVTGGNWRYDKDDPTDSWFDE